MSKLFSIINKDKPGVLETRLAERPKHVDYLKGLGAQLVLAGPFLDADGNPCGSLVVVKADDLAQAKAIAAADPYVGADMFASSEVSGWQWTLNAPEGI